MITNLRVEFSKGEKYSRKKSSEKIKNEEQD